jgi:hypothetical protein
VDDDDEEEEEECEEEEVAEEAGRGGGRGANAPAEDIATSRWTMDGRIMVVYLLAWMDEWGSVFLPIGWFVADRKGGAEEAGPGDGGIGDDVDGGTDEPD